MLAETCASLLRTARPLHTIFGPYYRPEILAEQCHRSPSPSPAQLNVTRLPIGIRMERRRYFSNLPLREELMKLYRVRPVLSGWNQKHCTPILTAAGNAQTTVPRQRVREMRQQTVAKVASCIQDHFCREYRVEVFGSTQYGVDGQTSDLDMVVIVGISSNASSSE